jgi:hypothetical protein
MQKCLLQGNLPQAMWEVSSQGLGQKVLEIVHNFSRNFLVSQILINSL